MSEGESKQTTKIDQTNFFRETESDVLCSWLKFACDLIPLLFLWVRKLILKKAVELIYGNSCVVLFHRPFANSEKAAIKLCSFYIFEGKINLVIITIPFNKTASRSYHNFGIKLIAESMLKCNRDSFIFRNLNRRPVNCESWLIEHHLFCQCFKDFLHQRNCWISTIKN